MQIFYVMNPQSNEIFAPASDGTSEVIIDNALLGPNEIIDQSAEKTKPWVVALRAGQMALLTAEILPITNEGGRLAIFGLAEAATRNPYLAGGALGLSTFVIEGVGGLAAAGLFNTERSRKAFEKINEKAEKVGVPQDKKLSVATKAGWTFMGGTVVGMVLEQREDPSRTVAQNRRYSAFTSAWQGSILAVAGTLTAEGINVGLESPKTGALIAAAVAGIVAVGTKTKKYITTQRAKKNRDHDVS